MSLASFRGPRNHSGTHGIGVVRSIPAVAVRDWNFVVQRLQITIHGTL